jgi:hypothetical protein
MINVYFVLIKEGEAFRYEGSTFTGEKAEIDYKRHPTVIKRDIESFRVSGFGEDRE